MLCWGNLNTRSRYPQPLRGLMEGWGRGRGRKRKVRKRRGREDHEEEGGGAGRRGPEEQSGSRTALAPSRGADVACIAVLFRTLCCVWKVMNFSTN